MGGKDSDSDGFPANIFAQIQAGHDKFMRELEEEGRRFQHKVERGSNDTPTKFSVSPLPPAGDDKNFFVSFKDFVDSSLGSLADSFKSLPSNIAELREKMQREREAREQEESEIWRRWTGIEDSSDHVQMMKERASPEERNQAVSAAVMLLEEAWKGNAHVSPEKIHALYKDGARFGELDRFATPMLSPGGACYYQPDSGYNAPSTVIWRLGTPNHRWLSIDWFKRSPYSPISLEHHPLLSDTSSKWRAAFEDLLNATLEKPMISREQIGQRIPYGTPQSTRTGPGLDWMLSLQCRGILPPQLSALYNEPGRTTASVYGLTKFVLGRPDQWSHFRGMLRQDMDSLVDEIRTPAPAQQYADHEVKFKTSIGHPETEQDLYEERDEQAYQTYQTQMAILERQENNKRQQAWFKEQQRLDARDELMDAVVNDDIDAAAECLTAWSDDGRRDLGDIVDDEEVRELFSKDVPKSLYLLVEAMRRGVGPDAIWDAEERELQREERLQQEREALGLLATPENERGSRQPSVSVGEKKVDVLSSLTTTQTTRLPDGTVTTKVVLKQRFADGREETEEKVHTYNDGVPSQPRQSEPERDDGSDSGSDGLQDYQHQLMLLEQHNKKRLLMARQEQDLLASAHETSQGPRAEEKQQPQKKKQGWFWT